MVPNRKRTRWSYLLPLATTLLGLGVLAYFGVDYAEQTVWLNRQHVVVYQPQTAMTATDDKMTKLSAPIWTPKPAAGEKIGEISFPRIHVEAPVIEGTGDAQLRHGAGHDPRSALPGEHSNVFIAGHRDTVFSKVRDLRIGDMVVLTTPYGEFTYRVTRFQVVPANDTSVLAPSRTETLTVSTCYPFDYFGSAPDRYIVFTKLVSEPPSLGMTGSHA